MSNNNTIPYAYPIPVHIIYMDMHIYRYSLPIITNEHMRYPEEKENTLQGTSESKFNL